MHDQCSAHYSFFGSTESRKSAAGYSFKYKCNSQAPCCQHHQPKHISGCCWLGVAVFMQESNQLLQQLNKLSPSSKVVIGAWHSPEGCPV